MSDPAIKVSGLSKQYQIGAAPAPTFRELLARAARGPARVFGGRKRVRRRQTFWALKDVSFDVHQGEVLGIIGRNGAGKSTLLKVLSRITEPTEGSIDLTGRIASLLEVGTGFHGELTGRENVFLNGAILGMSRQEVRRKFDEIVGFAEVEQFIDTPVKHYSSGMYLRLAFAVAAHLEPEILVVDEVLAVGDVAFQKKCLGKMESVSKRDGRTILFVSHNMTALQTLCDQVIHLDAGRVVGRGPASSTIEAYVRDANRVDHARWQRRVQLSASIALERMVFAPDPVKSGGELTFELELSSTAAMTLKDLAVGFYSEMGTKVALLDLRHPSADYRFGKGERLRLGGRIEHLDLVEGDYAIGLWVSGGDAMGHFNDLETVRVLPNPRHPEVIPYAPSDRGFAELRYSCARIDAAVEREAGVPLPQ